MTKLPASADESFGRMWEEGSGVFCFALVTPRTSVWLEAQAESGDGQARALWRAIGESIQGIERTARRNATKCLLCEETEFWRRSKLPAAFAVLTADVEAPRNVISCAVCQACRGRLGDGVLRACADKWSSFIVNADGFRILGGPVGPAGHA